MKAVRSFGLALLAGIFLFTLPGCQAIAEIFATATPTPTNTSTPTSTPTPTNTPTQTPTQTPTLTTTPTRTFTPTLTPTPVPPVTVAGCAQAADCPEAQSMRSFFPPDTTLEYDQNYPVNIPLSAKVRFAAGWCAIDQATLDDNLKKIEIVFRINGVPYAGLFKKVLATVPRTDDPSKNQFCQYAGAVLSGWQAGKAVDITVGLRFRENLNDGWDAYEAGDGFYTYHLNPVVYTATPLPTRTRTPPPTWTAAPWSPTPACGETGKIFITNNTKGILTLILSGPARYSYDLPAGEHTLTICGGSYTFTAYGCGGASMSGKIGTSGDTSHTFYCN